ncbi:UPF0449 protein C19orf25 homolog [Venturia canescens]|uniref:UPF0449 protein C19orf25 homolog n=1 Tax=Venturia canescens TaxID=32260 RepID=UPI001C9C35DC|nr:UPF0449 protein C19orf25 homolog [Venturia canescens]
MFGNKKNRVIPPRPPHPLPEQIIEDLKNANNSDVAFNIVRNDKSNGEDLHFPTNANDPVNVYKKVQTYLDVNEVLTILDEKLRANIDALKAIDEDIMKLAQEIKGQAQAALIE